MIEIVTEQLVWNVACWDGYLKKMKRHDADAIIPIFLNNTELFSNEIP